MSDLCNEIEKFGKGMGNASRYRIVEALFSGPKTVGELVKIVKQSQPAVSQHLKTLKANSLVQDQRQGQQIIYTLNSAYVFKLLNGLLTEMGKTKKSKK